MVQSRGPRERGVWARALRIHGLTGALAREAAREQESQRRDTCGQTRLRVSPLALQGAKALPSHSVELPEGQRGARAYVLCQGATQRAAQRRWNFNRLFNSEDS